MPGDAPRRMTEREDSADVKPDHQKDTEQRIADLEAALAASRAAPPLNPIPEHGAGPGFEIAETWSLAEQQAAQAAEL